MALSNRKNNSEEDQSVKIDLGHEFQAFAQALYNPDADQPSKDRTDGKTQQVMLPNGLSYEILAASVSQAEASTKIATAPTLEEKLDENNLLLKQLLFAYTSEHPDLDYSDIRSMTDLE